MYIMAFNKSSAAAKGAQKSMVSFENPIYGNQNGQQYNNAGQYSQPQYSDPQYAEVQNNAGQGTQGYIDVAGANNSSGYMDVQPGN